MEQETIVEPLEMQEVVMDMVENPEEIHEDDRVELFIEALIFAAQYALNVNEIKKVLKETFDVSFSKQEVEGYLQKIMDKYDQENTAIQLVAIAGGYMFMTKTQYHKIIGDFLKMTSKKKLSRASMETLSIIAYKQPVTKSEIEAIRGVSSDYGVQKLLEKELIEITGRHDGPGRPLLYGTSIKFLDHFGLKDPSDLPKLREMVAVEDTIGVVREEE